MNYKVFQIDWPSIAQDFMLLINPCLVFMILKILRLVLMVKV